MTDEQTATAAPTKEATRAPAQPAEAPAAAPQPAAPAKNGYWWGTGRRKSAVARVRIRPGDGKFLIKKAGTAKFREVETYFTEPQDRNAMRAALEATGTVGHVDVWVNVKGGGMTGQAGAILLGVARALKTYDPALEATLRDKGYLTRDPRKVERKKYGQPGARRKFQFSKR